MPSTSTRRSTAKPGEQMARPPAGADRLDPANPRDDDEIIDQASSESMDASDPPSFGGATGVGTPVADAFADGSEGFAVPEGFSNDDDERRQLIARRAYELWDAAGRPQEADLQFWYEAERELDMPEDFDSARN